MFAICCREREWPSDDMSNYPGTVFNQDKPSEEAEVAVVIPVGPGQAQALDTLESVEHYCGEPHVVVIVDDCTEDGTYEAMRSAQQPHWHILRNPQRQGSAKLIHTLCAAYRHVLEQTPCKLIFKMDVDALIIKSGVLPEALAFMRGHRKVGMYGVYERDYNRPRDFSTHTRRMAAETKWSKRWLGQKPWWYGYLQKAEKRGYVSGNNVFGGAYFLTSDCAKAARKLGALNPPPDWKSTLEQEDVYFSMVAVAAGYELGHFAAPEGPLCLEWQGLPMPPGALHASHYKVVHSVDKGKHTTAGENEGKTARQIFGDQRTGQ